MNVIFHTLSAVGIVVLVANTSKPILRKDLVFKSFAAFVLGILVHGVLDYIPHRYPVASKVDVIVSLMLICCLIFKAGRVYRMIVASSVLGCIFPDIVDLSSGIINKYLHLHLPVIQKVFPWHWPQYSGSVYEGHMGISLLNHMMVVSLILMVCIWRRRSFKNIFLSGKDSSKGNS